MASGTEPYRSQTFPGRPPCRGTAASQLKLLCARFDQYEERAIHLNAVGTALPGIVVGVVAVLKFLGKL